MWNTTCNANYINYSNVETIGGRGPSAPSPTQKPSWLLLQERWSHSDGSHHSRVTHFLVARMGCQARPITKRARCLPQPDGSNYNAKGCIHPAHYKAPMYGGGLIPNCLDRCSRISTSGHADPSVWFIAYSALIRKKQAVNFNTREN